MGKKSSAFVYRTIYEAKFYLFVRLVFESLFPRQELVDSLHIDPVCFALVQLLRSDTHRGLTLNLPPRTLKSVIASTAFPLYALIHKRDIRILILAGTHDLQAELLKNMETVLKSARFLSLFGDLTYHRERSELRFPGGGTIQFQTYGLDIIGKGFDLCVIDDPQSPAASKIKRSREEINSYFDASVLPRMNNRSHGRIVVVQQRLHIDDLSGHLAGQPNWNKLSIPAISDHDEVWRTEQSCAFRGRGLPICAERETFDQALERLESLGGYDFMAQYQQSPLSDSDQSGHRGVMGYRRLADGTFSAAPGLYKLTATEEVRARVFGIDPGFTLIPPRPLTLEEWEAETMVQQAALLAAASEASSRRTTEDPIEIEATSSGDPNQTWEYRQLYAQQPLQGSLRLVRR